MNIELADQDEVAQYQDVIDEILQAVDHSEALVTDESQLSDFNVIMDEEGDQELIDLIYNRFGIEVEVTDRLVDIARRVG